MSGKVNETISLFIGKLSEATGYRYLKSSRSLKKTIGQIIFEVIFFSSKWNDDNYIGINAEFRVSYKKFGAVSTIHSIVASRSFQPDKEYWYDISSKDKFDEILKFFEGELRATVIDLSDRFDKDPEDACRYLLEEKFSEYHLLFDFLTDVLGEERVMYRVNGFIEQLDESDRQQIADYKKGIRNKTWMLNRSNMRFVVDNGYI
ncbi:hypothetical protein [Ruminococcus sp.]|uniref:hypothetical protein n=1 Tax=Ruminococcus sp. TaxID=41978 RepID=UPI0025E92DEA|nr:hypothetical protein [Ruminococcus sp.]MBQ8967385.1 hypothetical protein [Ruminococcus sp.]